MKNEQYCYTIGLPGMERYYPFAERILNDESSSGVFCMFETSDAQVRQDFLTPALWNSRTQLKDRVYRVT